MSAFPVCVCSDLYENKINLEVPFNARPTMPELTQKIREVFDYEANTMKPPTAAPRAFQISRMQIYNDELGKWEDLHRAEQLNQNCQVYCFQPNIIDTQADLPRVRQPKYPFQGGAPNTSYAASPSPYQSAAPGYPQPQQSQQQPAPQSYPGYQQPPPQGQVQPALGLADAARSRPHVDLEEKVRIVFGELDTNGKQFLDYGDLERGFKTRGLNFAVNTIGELFHKADLNRDGRIMFDEWITWCNIYPNTLDAMYFRGKDTGEEADIRKKIRQIQDMKDADHLAHDLLNDLLQRSATPGQLGNGVQSLNRYLGPAAQALHADPSRDVRPDIQRALEDLGTEAAQRERQLPELEQQLRAAQERRQTLENQEMNLLEQEIRLERQRDAMRAQQAKYTEAEQLFNSKANETGSPRRAIRIQ